MTSTGGLRFRDPIEYSSRHPGVSAWELNGRTYVRVERPANRIVFIGVYEAPFGLFHVERLLENVEVYRVGRNGLERFAGYLEGEQRERMRLALIDVIEESLSLLAEPAHLWKCPHRRAPSDPCCFCRWRLK